MSESAREAAVVLAGWLGLIPHPGLPTWMEQRLQYIEQALIAYARDAVAQRDREWWETLTPVDAVPATPAAVKLWLAVVHEGAVKVAVSEAVQKMLAACPECGDMADPTPGDPGDPWGRRLIVGARREYGCTRCAPFRAAAEEVGK